MFVLLTDIVITYPLCLTWPSVPCSFTDKHFMRWSENDSPHESLWWVEKAIFTMPRPFFSSSALQISDLFDRVVCLFLQMISWQTREWTSHLRWMSSCLPAQLSSSAVPSIRPPWTTPARGKAAPQTTSKSNSELHSCRSCCTSSLVSNCINTVYSFNF